MSPIGALWSSLKLSEALWSSLNIAFALLLLCLCCACAVLCIALNCLALLCCAMLCFASLCILRNTSVDPCISMHGSQWARSLRGLVVVLSDGGLSGSSAMPLGIHSWKSGKAAEYLKIHIFAVDSPFFACWPERQKLKGPVGVGRNFQNLKSKKLQFEISFENWTPQKIFLEKMFAEARGGWPWGLFLDFGRKLDTT